MEDTTSNASIVRQNFGGDELQVQHETSSAALAAAAKAHIEARFIVAMKRPRDWDTVEERLLKECRRPGLAYQAIYRKPVGSKFDRETQEWKEQYVEGLSIRFAEAALRNVSNFDVTQTSIYDDPQKSITRVAVIDLETNASVSIDLTVAKTVERKKLKDGQKPLGQRLNSYNEVVYLVPATDDDVQNKLGAQASKAIRTLILRLLPGDIQEACENECRLTMKKEDAKDPAAAKKAIFRAFGKMEIEPHQVKEYLGHDNELLTDEELRELRGIWSAIHGGETSWRAVFEAKHPPAASTIADLGSQSTAAKKTAAIIDQHKTKADQKRAGATPTTEPAAESPPAEEKKQEPMEPVPPRIREIGEEG